MFFYRRNSFLMEHPLLVSLIAFAIGAFSIHNALRYAAVAPNEKITQADVTTYRNSMHTRGHSHFSFSTFSRSYPCSYNFSADGETYSSSGEVSELSVDDSIKAELQQYTDEPLRFNATVYYDPLNPSTNSLTEYGVLSDGNYRIAELSIGAGVIFVILVVLGVVLTAGAKLGSGGIVVDAEGTVIYPDKINSEQPGVADNPAQIGSRDQQSDDSESPIQRY